MGKRSTLYGVSLGLAVCLWIASRSTIIWMQAHAENLGVKEINAQLPFPFPFIAPTGSLTITTDLLDKLNVLSLTMPWYLLVSFGCYCLYKLGSDLLNFRNCPEEIKKLETDITNARKDLSKRGFKAE